MEELVRDEDFMEELGGPLNMEVGEGDEVSVEMNVCYVVEMSCSRTSLVV